MDILIINVDTPLTVPMPFTNRYQLERDLELKYSVDGVVKSVVIPSGYLTDGASIPAVAWQIIGTPYEPRFLTAAIVHDYMCDNDWDVETMSVIFMLLLVLSNVSLSKAELMYKAVYAYKGVV